MAKLAIIYGTGFGNTRLMARAIQEGAASEGVEVVLKNITEASLDDLKDASAIALGSPTYKGAGMPTMLKFAEEIGSLDLKDKIGTAFGSYGWSGEAAQQLIDKMKSYGMKKVLEPGLRIKRIPDEDGIEVCRNLGKVLAQKIK